MRKMLQFHEQMMKAQHKKESAINAIEPAIKNDNMTDGPANPAATPLITKIPAPIMFAIPSDVTPNSPKFRFSLWWIRHCTLLS